MVTPVMAIDLGPTSSWAELEVKVKERIETIVSTHVIMRIRRLIRGSFSEDAIADRYVHESSHTSGLLRDLMARLREVMSSDRQVLLSACPGVNLQAALRVDAIAARTTLGS
jgi:hypothetical protein